jgi:hypothetical protein
MSTTISDAVLAKLRKLNVESTLEPKMYSSHTFDLSKGSHQFIKTRLPERYIDLVISLMAYCGMDDKLFESLAASSITCSTERRAIVDKLDVNKVGWRCALGMTRNPSPYTIESIADCIIELFVLDYDERGLTDSTEIKGFDMDA